MKKLPIVVNILFTSAKLRKTLKNLLRGNVEVFDKVFEKVWSNNFVEEK